MSKATPFIAKVFLTNNGQNWPAAQWYAVYDNSGNALVPCNQAPPNIPCLIRAMPNGGVTSPDQLGLAIESQQTMPFPMIDVDFGGSASDTPAPFLYTFHYGTKQSTPTTILSLSANPTPTPASQLAFWTVAGVPNFSTQLGWLDPSGLGKSGVTSAPIGVTVTTPGSSQLLFNSDANFVVLYQHENNRQVPLLDFQYLDLSGEDWTQALFGGYTLPGGGIGSPPSIWSYADLSNASFRQNSVANATFDYAILNETDFTYGYLSHSTFKGATARILYFQGTSLDAVSFEGAQIFNAQFDPSTTYSNVDFTNASLTYAYFKDCVLDGLSFDHTDLTGATFTGASLKGTSFNGATLTNALFDQTNLEGTLLTNTDVTTIDFTGATFSTDPANPTSFAGSVIGLNLKNDWKYLDLSNASLASEFKGTVTNLDAQFANLSGMKLSGVTFKAKDPENAPTNFANTTLAGTNFSGADLTSANFTSANCEPDPANGFPTSAVFTGANLNDVQFDEALLSGVDFSFALLWGGSASLDGATITDTVFANAFLVAADFSGIKDSQCGGVVFTGACLANAIFKNTTLEEGALGTPVLFDGAFLGGADFTGAAFDAVSLDRAVLADTSGTITPVFKTKSGGNEPGFPIDYTATLLTPSQTTSGTICVNDSTGPCSGPGLAPPSPMPTKWTQPAALAM